MMNAYLIAAKANAWEINQHVGRGVEADQPEYMIEAIGQGAGSYHEDGDKSLKSHGFFKGFFSAN